MNPNELKTEHLPSRKIRVFISSTFRDMQEERELLVKKVFPELRRICDDRFVSFTEVDLRWGITQEEAAEGKVLPICLEEIHTCRPFFIGILGERYGWIPDTVPPEVIEKESWIKEHIGNRNSVTELEILHGVLNNPKMDGHAFFYFRDPAYSAQRDEDFQTENPGSAAKLSALKETIRKSGRPLVDPYKNPAELAATVERQFRDLIDKLYPKEEVPDPLDQQAADHRSHALRKTLAYVDRPDHSQALADFVAAPSTGKGLVVTGDSGGGKTTLLAAFATSSFETSPLPFVFEHYFGATPDSANVDGFLLRLLGELKQKADIKDDMPTTPEMMRDALPLWLSQTSGGKPIVLVLDGLNQIQGDEADRRLNWLPRFFPTHIRVIASCLPGPALDILRERGWAEHLLPLTDTADRGRMLDAFLKNYHKELGKTLRNQIIQADGAANPLFLRTVLEELRQYGDFDKLPDKVAEYLTVTSLQDLFRLVIRRWQDDFHAGRDMVNRSLRHLWAARHGLSDTEWLELLADESGPLDRQTWRPLFLAMEPHLVQRGSLWAFGHDFLRQAVTDELFHTVEAQRHAHHVLGDFFGARYAAPIITGRMAAEAPWNAVAAEHWELARRILNDLAWLEIICQTSIRDADIYWRTMEQAKADFFVVALRRHLDGPKSALTIIRLDILSELATQYCLYDNDGRKEVLRAIIALRERLMKDEAANGLQLVMLELRQGNLYMQASMEDYMYRLKLLDNASDCFLNALEQANDLGNTRLVGTISGALGTLHFNKAGLFVQKTGFISLWKFGREIKKADRMFQREYLASIQANDAKMTFLALTGFFGIHLLLGKKMKRSEVFQAVLQLVEQESIPDTDTLALAYAMLGKSCLISGNNMQAAQYYEQAISCCRLVGNYYQLPKMLLDLAEVLLSEIAEGKDGWEATEQLCAEAVQILQGQNGREDVLAYAKHFAWQVQIFQKYPSKKQQSLARSFLRRWCWKPKISPFGHFLLRLLLKRILPIIGLIIILMVLLSRQ